MLNTCVSVCVGRGGQQWLQAAEASSVKHINYSQCSLKSIMNPSSAQLSTQQKMSPLQTRDGGLKSHGWGPLMGQGSGHEGQRDNRIVAQRQAGSWSAPGGSQRSL